MSVQTACVVVPTYNEAQNIKRTLDLVFHHERRQEKDPFVLHVLVVDDGSPDGTAAIVEDYRLTNPRVHLLRRKEKNGLGAAYIAGMRHALATLKPDAIMEMDADGQHDPADIVRLLGGLRGGADFVIGSRYVDGGSVPASWGPRRKFISACANLVTRTMLGTRGVKDCSGGFRAIRASLLETVDFDSLRVKGYAFQAVLLEEALHRGAIVREVPIAFSDRTNGESKMGLRELTEGFHVFAGIRARRLHGDPAARKFLLFGVVGGLGTLINSAILWLLTSFAGMHYLAASIIATEAAIICNFTGNHLFTFRGSANTSPAWRKFALFQAVSMLSLVCTVSVLWMLATVLGQRLLILWNLIAILSAFLLNFTLNRKFTWSETAVQEPPAVTAAGGTALSRFYAVLISAYCVLLPALVAARAVRNFDIQYFPDALHVQGAWLACAQDFAHGVFYRPLEGPLGYGGTRFMPLYFVLTAVLSKFAGSLESSGLIISAVSVVLLAYGCYAVLRRLNVGVLLSAAGMAAILAAATTQKVLLETRGDGLAAMLNVFGILLCITPKAARRTLFLAAIMFSLAFASKMTSIFGVAAVTAHLILVRRRDEARDLAAATSFGYALVLGAIYFGSQGRALEVFRACAAGGGSLIGFLKAPLREIQTASDAGPLILLFCIPATVLALAYFEKLKTDLLSIYFALVLLATTAIFASPGIAGNHLLDLYVAAVLLCAFSIHHNRALTQSGMGMIAFILTVGCAATAGDLHLDYVRPSFRAGLHEALRGLPADGRPVLAENPLVVLESGGMPYLLDAFAFRVFTLKRPELGRALYEKLNHKGFSAIVLMNEPGGERSKNWYTDVHFGGEFLKNLEANYDFSRDDSRGEFRVYTPKRLPRVGHAPPIVLR